MEIYASLVLLARHCPNIEDRCFSRQLWRRGRDLNPRQGFWPCDGLANRCLRPLGHLSTQQRETSSCTLRQWNNVRSLTKSPQSKVKKRGPPAPTTGLDDTSAE